MNRYEGPVCHRCGTTTRYTYDKRCVKCRLDAAKKRYRLDPYRHLERIKVYDEAHREEKNEYARKYRQTEKGKLVNREGQRRWYARQKLKKLTSDVQSDTIGV